MTEQQQKEKIEYILYSYYSKIRKILSRGSPENCYDVGAKYNSETSKVAEKIIKIIKK